MGEARGKQIPPSCLAKSPVQVTQAGNPECAARRTSGLPAPAQPLWVRRHRRLDKVVTVSCDALDPREPNAEKAAKAAEVTSLLTSCIPLPEIFQEASRNAGTIGLLSPDSLELGLLFESGCEHPPRPLD